MNSNSTKPTAAHGQSPQRHAAQPSWLPSPTPTKNDGPLSNLEPTAKPPSWLSSPTPQKSNASGNNLATNPAKPSATSQRDRLTNAQLQEIPLQRLRTLHDQIKAEAATAMRKASRLQREQVRIKRAINRKTQAEKQCAE